MNARKGFQRRDVLAGEEDIAAAGMVLAEDQTEQRALAGAVRTDQAVDLTGFEREVDRVGDVQTTEVLVQLAKFEQRHQSSPRLRRAASRPSQFMTPSTRPFGCDQHGQHQQHAHEDERILAAVDRQRLESREHHQRADHGRGEIAASADRDPDQRQRGSGHAHARRRDVLPPYRVEHARKARERGTDHEGDELILAHVVAQHLRALRILADRDDDIAEGRVHQDAQAEIDDDQQAEHDVIEADIGKQHDRHRPATGMVSGGIALIPLKPFSRATPTCHSGPAVWAMKRSSIKVTASVTMPRNTPAMRPKNMK